MPSGDYLVLLGGASHTPPATFNDAFAAIGKTADIWDWDDLGMPTVAILQAYDGVIIDESWYLDASGLPTAWPWTYDRFEEEMQAPKLDDYDMK